MADLDEVLADDRDRLMIPDPGQSIEHREHAPGGRVLDGKDEAIDFTALERGKARHEGRKPDGRFVGVQLDGGPVAVGEGFALIADLHGRAE